MDFLKDVLGDSYGDFETKLNSYNETNKDKQIKLANLGLGEYVGKGKYTDLETEANGYKTQLKELNKQLETLKGAAGNSEEMKAQIQQWQDKYKADTEKLMSDIENNKMTYAIDLALAEAKAKNSKAVKALLDMSSISMKDGALNGFAEQLDAIKKDNDYLFHSPTSDIPSGTGMQGATTGTKSELEQLEDQLKDAQSKGNFPLAIALKNKIFSLSKK